MGAAGSARPPAGRVFPKSCPCPTPRGTPTALRSPAAFQAPELPSSLVSGSSPGHPRGAESQLKPSRSEGRKPLPRVSISTKWDQVSLSYPVTQVQGQAVRGSEGSAISQPPFNLPIHHPEGVALILSPQWLQELQPSRPHPGQQDGGREERRCPLRTLPGRPTLLRPPWPELAGSPRSGVGCGWSDSQLARAGPCVHSNSPSSPVPCRGEVRFPAPDSGLGPVTCLVLPAPRQEEGYKQRRETSSCIRAGPACRDPSAGRRARPDAPSGR